MEQNRTVACLLAVLVVVAGVPAVATAALGDAATADGQSTPTAAQSNNTTQERTASTDSVNVTAGQQLSTVISATSDDVESEVEETDFEFEYENGSEESRAGLVAERGEQLADRAESIREDYEDATESYEAGELTRSEYAQRIATLNSRAENVVDGYETLSNRSANISEFELRAAGLNRTALEQSVENLDSVRGTGAAALLQRYTGTDSGEIEIETTGGLSVEVSGEDGEFSREINRDRDDDRSINVSQSAALETARGALSAPTNASWTLREASIHEDSGHYEFEFGFRTADQVGEAEIRVDGSSGEVFRLEEEVELTDEAEEEREEAEEEREEAEEEREEAKEEREEAEEEREYSLLVTNGTVAADETVAVQALLDGAPAANVTVYMNDEPVGTTGADGTVSVTLPAGGDVELTAGEGELEFELRERDDDDVYRNLRADTTLANGTVTVTVTYDGEGVENASVYANDEQVATTGSDGTASFTAPEGVEDLDIEVVKGEFEAEFEYELVNGTLTQTEGPDGSEEETEDEETEAADEAETDTEDEEESADEETETEDDDSEDEETEDDEEDDN